MRKIRPYPIALVTAALVALIAAPQITAPLAAKWPWVNNLVVVGQMGIFFLFGIHFLVRRSSFYAKNKKTELSHIYFVRLVGLGVAWAAIFLYQDIIGLVSRAVPLMDVARHQLNGPLIAMAIGISVLVVEDSHRVKLLAWVVLVPMIVMIPLNYAGRLAGLEGVGYGAELREQAHMLSQLGLNLDRLAFPFSSGLNSFGASCGLVMVLGVVFMSFAQGKRIYFWMGAGLILLGAVGVLIADTRAAILYSVFIMGSLIFRKKIGLKVLWVVIFIIPFAVPSGITLIAKLVEEFNLTGILSRGRAVSAAEAISSARTIIWDGFFAFASDFKAQHLMGYGFYGHFSSGLSQQYMAIFGVGGMGATLHNGVLQSLIDMGWIVAPISFGMTFVAGLGFSRLLEQQRDSKEQLTLAALFWSYAYVWACTSTEALIGGYRLEIQAFWVVATAFGWAAFKESSAAFRRQAEVP